MVGRSVVWSVTLSSNSSENGILRILNDLDSAGRGGWRDEEERGRRRNEGERGTRRIEGRGGTSDEEQRGGKREKEAGAKERIKCGWEDLKLDWKSFRME